MKFSPPRLWLRYPFSKAVRFLDTEGKYDLEGHVFVFGWWAVSVLWRREKAAEVP